MKKTREEMVRSLSNLAADKVREYYKALEDEDVEMDYNFAFGTSDQIEKSKVDFELPDCDLDFVNKCKCSINQLMITGCICGGK